MRLVSRKLIAALIATGAAAVMTVGLAYGCVALVAFRTTGSGVVQPGGTVEVFGGEFARGRPVSIRLDSPTGPVLATYESPQPSTMTSQFTMSVPIPADITPGPHFLVATQDHYDMNVGIPARAAIYVGTSAPVAPIPVERPTALAVEDEQGVAPYLFVGLGVAAAGLVVAGAASLLASRGGAKAQPSASKPA